MMKRKIPTGLICPHCGCAKFRTVNTKPRGGVIHRRKRCLVCGRAMITCEKIIVQNA
jgi:transcriptional regulator NrdR family protein